MASKAKLDIFKLLNAIDNKHYNFYDELDVNEQKGFSAYLGLKWASSVEGDSVLQHYYIASMNYHANKHLFDIASHPKLQWLSLVAGSPNFGKQRHTWISPKTSTLPKKTKDLIKELKKMHPTYNDDEIYILSKKVTKKDISQYYKDRGQ